jgi:hypothetical protein
MRREEGGNRIRTPSPLHNQRRYRHRHQANLCGFNIVCHKDELFVARTIKYVNASKIRS